jgi:cytochrome c peroxidase
VAVGIGGAAGVRNTPTIFNLAFVPDSSASPGFLWDGRAASVVAAIALALENPREMGLRPERVPEVLAGDARRFREATGGPPTFDSVAGAVTAYVLTLTAANSPVDRYLYCDEPSALTAAERRGLELFAGRANCVRCHVFEHEMVHPLGGRRALFTDRRFHNVGAGRGGDRGRGVVTGQSGDDGSFKTPTLRNVALTAPYMHDGSLATLEDVVDFYNKGGGGGPRLDRNIVPLHLGTDEKSALVAFLRALTTEEFRPPP